MISNRRRAVFYLVVAAVGILLLAAGLPGLRLQAGLPIPGAAATALPGAAVETRSARAPVMSPWLLEGGLALVLTAAFIALIASLIKKANIKRIAQLALGVIVLFALFNLLPAALPAAAVPSYENQLNTETAPDIVYDIAPIGDPPVSLVRLVTAALLLSAVGLAAWLALKTFRQAPLPDGLSREAGAALQAIEDGQDLHGVIIQCYLQMVRVVQEEQGIERGESLTPREFEKLLTARGIASLPIHQLTGLFERARYGGKTPAPQDEQTAVSCLSAIQQSCQSHVRRAA